VHNNKNEKTTNNKAFISGMLYLHMRRPPKKPFGEKPERRKRLERFMQRLEPTMREARVESLARETARNDLVPSFLEWIEKRMTVLIKQRALNEMKALGIISMPVRSASLFKEKQQLVEAISKHFELFYEKRKEWPPNVRLAFLAEFKHCLLEIERELKKQEQMTPSLKQVELKKWRKKGIKIDKRIEDSFLRETNKTLADTKKALVNTLLPLINKKITEAQIELKQRG